MMLPSFLLPAHNGAPEGLNDAPSLLCSLLKAGRGGGLVLQQQQ